MLAGHSYDNHLWLLYCLTVSVFIGKGAVHGTVAHAEFHSGFWSMEKSEFNRALKIGVSISNDRVRYCVMCVLRANQAK